MSGVEVLAELEAKCRRGEMTPVPVVLGPLPAAAGPVMREIAADIEWLIGVRLAAGYPLELPYSVSMAVTRGLAKDPSTASKALGNLVRLGVLRSAGKLRPQRPGCSGTKLYAPPEPSVKAQPLVPSTSTSNLSPDATGSEEAVVQAFIDGFDGTEMTGEVVA